MGVGPLMRIVRTALFMVCAVGVKEREKKRKGDGAAAAPSALIGVIHLSWDYFQICACGEGEIFVCVQLIFLSLLLSVGVAPAKKSPKLVSTDVSFSVCSFLFTTFFFIINLLHIVSGCFCSLSVALV